MKLLPRPIRRGFVLRRPGRGIIRVSRNKSESAHLGNAWRCCELSLDANYGRVRHDE